MRETNFTLGPIQKSLYLLLLYQFTFAQNRPKSDISGALRPLHYITLKAFAMALADVLSVLEWSYVPEKNLFFSLRKIGSG